MKLLTILWFVTATSSGISLFLLLTKNEHARLFSLCTLLITVSSLAISYLSGGMQHDEMIEALERNKNETISVVNREFDKTFEERVEDATDVIFKKDIFWVLLEMRTGRDAPWEKVLDSNIGDEIEFQIHYKNNANGKAENVMMSVSLPSGFSYIEDSATLYNESHPNGIAYEDLTSAPVNIGDYAPFGDAYMRFRVRIQDSNYEEGKTNRYITWTTVSANNEALSDHTQVYVAVNSDN